MSISLTEINLEKSQVVASNSTGEPKERKTTLNREIKFFSKKTSDRKKENFYSEMGILLSSGIDIKTALEIFVEQQKRESDKKLFVKIFDSVISGSSLSEAVELSGKFSPYEYFSLKIAEESGRQIKVLKELTHFFASRIKQKRQLTNAITYPILVLVTATVAVYFMLAFIVPLFEDVFLRFDGELPVLTQKIISFSDFLSNNFIKMILVIITIIISVMVVKKKNWYRAFSSKVILGLPIFGGIIRKVFLARFCQTMALLISSKTPMLKSIELVIKMIQFYPFEKALSSIQNDILHGKSLNEGMSGFKIFDSRIISLTRVAEQVNQLDRVFEKLSNQYSEELEHQISLLSSLLEPILIILVGLLVALVLISMYLPLFQLSTSIL